LFHVDNRQWRRETLILLRAVEVEAFVRSMRIGLRLGVLMLLAANVAAQSAHPIRGVPAAPGPWKQLAKLTESNGRAEDYAGWSVAISKDGGTVAVGAAGWCRYQGVEGCGQGAVYVFVKPASGWADMTETALLLASDGKPGDYLGESVAISDDGSTIVSGAPVWPADGSGSGALYVFGRPKGGWKSETEGAILHATDAGTNLGQSVAMSGGTIVGGAEYFNGFQGAAYVFVESKRGWTNMTQTARLTPSDGKQGFMGDSVSVSGDTVVAGAPETGLGGAGNGAYVFVKPKNGWKDKTENAKLTPSKGQNLGFGFAASVVGSTVAIGARVKGNGNGSIYVYEKPAHGWRRMTETARLTVPLKSTFLGYSVSVDPSGAAIAGGAPGWQGQGAVDFFVKPQSGWRTTSKVRAQLAATDGQSMDNLGFSVAASPGIIISGAPYATVGSDREQGAAYLFGH
jgi:hypothetical protein